MVVAVVLVAATTALSGCGMATMVTDTRDASIRNTVTAISDALDCFAELTIADGDDLVALARQKELCGDWRTLGATDEQLSTWHYDGWNTNWLMRIDESGSRPIITVMTEGDARTQVMTQQETHRVIVCWQATLDPDGGKPDLAAFDCPEDWHVTIGAAEVMTLGELSAAARDRGVTFDP